MSTLPTDKLTARVARAAEALLAGGDVVTPIGVLVGLGWLAQSQVDAWRQGRVEYLEDFVAVDTAKVEAALERLRLWAAERSLVPSETTDLARTRDHRPLRFSAGGDPEIELACRIHWMSPSLPEEQRRRRARRDSRAPDLVVISPLTDFTCTSCGDGGELLIMEGPGPLCLGCADMDHLVFLPAGDAALTRRAKKSSELSAVVVRFSRTRRRYERQGVLVEETALQQAEEECLADDEARARRRQRDQERRSRLDERFEAELAEAVHRLYPGCPPDRAAEIARHTAARGSGRVGRSAAGRALDPGAVTLAVAASVRHRDTTYDQLLMAGTPRAEARHLVGDDVPAILRRWQLAVVPAGTSTNDPPDAP